MIVWELWRRDGRAIRCEINAHPDGHEVVLVDARGTVVPQIFPTPAAAQGEANARRDALIAAGWHARHLRLVN
jgi:hypothetical protein